MMNGDMAWFNTTNTAKGGERMCKLYGNGLVKRIDIMVETLPFHTVVNIITDNVTRSQSPIFFACGCVGRVPCNQLDGPLMISIPHDDRLANLRSTALCFNFNGEYDPDFDLLAYVEEGIPADKLTLCIGRYLDRDGILNLPRMWGNEVDFVYPADGEITPDDYAAREYDAENKLGEFAEPDEQRIGGFRVRHYDPIDEEGLDG